MDRFIDNELIIQSQELTQNLESHLTLRNLYRLENSIDKIPKFNTIAPEFSIINPGCTVKTLSRVCYESDMFGIERIKDKKNNTEYFITCTNISYGKDNLIRYISMLDIESTWIMHRYSYNLDITRSIVESANIDSNIIIKTINTISSYNLGVLCLYNRMYERRCNENNIKVSLVGRRYRELIPIEGMINLHGILAINQLVYMNNSDTNDVPDLEQRQYNNNYLGFICTGHTAHSSEVGNVRKVCSEVIINIPTRKSIEVLINMINTLEEDRNSSYVFYCCGIMFSISRRSYNNLISDFVNLNKHFIILKFLENLELNITVVVCNIEVGVLLRKVENIYVDNIIYNNTSLIPYIIPDPSYSLNTSFSTTFSLLPFITYNRPPRTLVASCQSVQSISLPASICNSKAIPLYTEIPLIITPLMKKIFPTNSLLKKYCPGVNLCTVLCNINDNYEDCFVVRNNPSVLHKFEYEESMWIPIIRGAKEPCIGDILDNTNCSWWSLPYSVKVIDKEITKSSDCKILVYRKATLVDGDKIITNHGQKGVVKLVDDSKLPIFKTKNGIVIKPDLILSLSSIISRVTLGQILELRLSHIVKDNNKDYMCTDELMLKVKDKTLGEPKVVYIYNNNNEKIITNNIENTAEYGFIRTYLVYHFADHKQHYTRVESKPTSKFVPGGKWKGGSIRLGDMEFHALASVGCSNILDEIKSRMDLMVVDCCGKCSRIIVLCDCNNKNNSTIAMRIPSSTIMLDYILAVVYGRSFKYT